MMFGGNTTYGLMRHGSRLRNAVFVLSVLWLGACETTPPSHGVEQQSGIEAKVAPLSQSSNVIHVLPVKGLDNPLRLVLADAVAASLRDTDRPAVLADTSNNQGPSILIELQNVRERGSVVWVSTRWKLRAPYGTIVAERKREMVIDKLLWRQDSVETVNLIIDDAMPAVAAMVRDYVGPTHMADRAPGPEATLGIVQSEATATPILGRAELTDQPLIDPPPAETLPAGVGQPAPPENLILDLPIASETDPEPALQVSSPPTHAKPAGSPPMVLAPRPEDTPPGRSAEQSNLAEPVPLSGPTRPKTAAGIAATPEDTPLRWGKPSFLIRPVRGAPGDGNQVLAQAISAALRGKDLTVTEDPRQAGYEVVGKVDVGPPVNGRQRARITWVVSTASGQEVGKAVQENVVAAGSLNGRWGRVAVLVSSAAANGIQQLFEAPRPNYTPVGAVPTFPKIPRLPQVPGRALPPPT
jgi:hypothetical protein